MANIIKIAFLFTTIVLGAGFASGQEINTFFVAFNSKGIIGLFISGLIFAIVGAGTLYICYKHNFKNYSDFTKHIFGTKFGSCMELLVAIFLFIILVSMIAAGSATINETLHLNKYSTILIIGGLCFITLLFDVEEMAKVNTVLAPLMIFGIILIGLHSLINIHKPVFLQSRAPSGSNFLISSLVYSSYNLITTITVLACMKNFLTNKKTAIYGGMLGGGIMTILGICLFLPLDINYNKLVYSELPVLTLVSDYNVVIKYFYILVLILAILTTAIANGFAFVEWFCNKFKINRLLISFFVIVIACVFSTAGFSTLVKKIYPIFGYIGLIQVIIISYTFILELMHKEQSRL